MRVLATGPSGPLAELDPLRDAGHEVIIGRPLDQPGRKAYTEVELIVPLIGTDKIDVRTATRLVGCLTSRSIGSVRTTLAFVPVAELQEEIEL